MLLERIKKYAELTPTQTVEQLKLDLQCPLFLKTALATFSDTKYYLSPDKFQAFMSSKKCQPADPDAALTLDVSSPVWQVLEALGSGDLSGDAAKQALADVYQALPVCDKQVVLGILDKTWRVGVTVDTINQARPGTFRPAKFMLAQNYRDRLAKGKVTFPMLATIKYDGFRAVYCQDTQRGLSRAGNPFPLTQDLKNALNELGRQLKASYGTDYLPAIDGELFAGSWKATAEARATGYGRMIVFGMLPSDMIYGGTSEEFDVEEFLDHVDYLIDEMDLGEWLSTAERRVVNNPQEVEAFFAEALERNLEGLVLTTKVRPYEGKRSYHWLKVKAEETLDLPITGAEMADARSKHAGLVGAVLVECEGVVSGAAGMPDDIRKRVTELHLAGDLAGLIAEIEFHEKTPDGKLRHARVKKIRFDKESA